MGDNAPGAWLQTPTSNRNSTKDKGGSEMKRMAPAFFASLLLYGCVSVGTKIDPAIVASFQPGITTISDAETKLGRPNNVTTDSDGTTTIVYAYTHAQASGSSYIPLVGPLVGHSDATTTTSTLTFDKTGKFVRYTTSQGQSSAGLINHG